MFTIIPSIRIDGKNYKLIQILTGALDIYTSISEKIQQQEHRIVEDTLRFLS